MRVNSLREYFSFVEMLGKKTVSKYLIVAKVKRDAHTHKAFLTNNFTWTVKKDYL